MFGRVNHGFSGLLVRPSLVWTIHIRCSHLISGTSLRSSGGAETQNPNQRYGNCIVISCHLFLTEQLSRVFYGQVLSLFTNRSSSSDSFHSNYEVKVTL